MAEASTTTVTGDPFRPHVGHRGFDIDHAVRGQELREEGLDLRTLRGLDQPTTHVLLQ